MTIVASVVLMSALQQTERQMSNPSLQVATRLKCVADDLESLKPFIPYATATAGELARVVRALRDSAHRLEGLPSPAPIQQPKVDAPSWGAGVSQ